jgi:hypothetical protein
MTTRKKRGLRAGDDVYWTTRDGVRMYGRISCVVSFVLRGHAEVELTNGLRGEGTHMLQLVPPDMLFLLP